ncbi:hypothetical protein [Vibrio mediterranei]|uniref:hypothetical protein n=1 Tax=Vibrio mediterranei TaxID=689 RepID=UPI004068D74B
MHHDISTSFQANAKDAKIINKILPHEGTARAIKIFEKHKKMLSDYGYWFTLGTLWVSYADATDIRLWRRLFNASRAKKLESLMKPSELQAYQTLPDTLTVYRGVRLNEQDCIAYTLDANIAMQWAIKREQRSIKAYKVKRTDITCLFLRRNESECIVLDRKLLTETEELPIQ